MNRNVIPKQSLFVFEFRLKIKTAKLGARDSRTITNYSKRLNNSNNLNSNIQQITNKRLKFYNHSKWNGKYVVRADVFSKFCKIVVFFIQLSNGWSIHYQSQSLVILQEYVFQTMCKYFIKQCEIFCFIKNTNKWIQWAKHLNFLLNSLEIFCIICSFTGKQCYKCKDHSNRFK